MDYSILITQWLNRDSSHWELIKYTENKEILYITYKNFDESTIRETQINVFELLILSKTY